MLKNDNYARTWLIRILINECYSLVRKSSKFIPLENLADRQEPESEKTKNYSELYTAVNSLKRGTAFTRYSILYRRFQCKRNRPDP